jgi:hypothetical protein
VGRQAAAATDWKLQAEILSYSRSRGLFAGVALDGTALTVNHGANSALYGFHGGTIRDVIVAKNVALPAEAEQFRAALAGPSVVPAAAHVPAPVPVQAAAGADPNAVRFALIRAVQALQGRVDDRWKAYFVLPEEVADPAKAPSHETIQQFLARFDTVQYDSKYRVISQLAEFQAAYALVKQYRYQLANASQPPQQSAASSFPPPPAQAAP